MQFNSSYLYPNKVDVFSDLGSWQTERYRKVYQRTLNAYRGVDNRIDFQVRNSDQKPQNITGFTVVFNMIAHESNELVVSRDCTIVDAVTGKIFVTLTENDLQSLSLGSYSFSLHTISSAGVKSPLYGDSQFGAMGLIEVVANIYGEIVPTEIVTTFGTVDSSRVSSVIDAKPELNSNAALHSFAFYGTSYTGTVIIQGSLDENNTSNNWVDLETISLTNSTISYKNVYGIWSWFRIKHTPTTGTIDKVLYRY